MAATLTTLEANFQTALDAMVTAGDIVHGDVLADDVADAQEVLRAAGNRPPYIIILYSGGDMKPINVAAGAYEHVPMYQALIGVRSIRNNDQVRTALHGILPAFMMAFSGNQFALDIEPCRIGRVTLISWAKPVMVFGVPITTRFQWVVATEAA